MKCSALFLFHILKEPDTNHCLKQLVLQLTFGGICGKKQRSSWLIHCCISFGVEDLVPRVVAASWSCNLWLCLVTFGRADGFSRVPVALSAPPITFHCHRRDRPLFIPSPLGTSCSSSVLLRHGQSPDFAHLSLSGSRGRPARGALLSGAARLWTLGVKKWVMGIAGRPCDIYSAIWMFLWLMTKLQLPRKLAVKSFLGPSFHQKFLNHIRLNSTPTSF